MLARGKPEYIVAVPQLQDGGDLPFYSILMIVLIFVVRHHAAVAVHVAEGSGKSVYGFPKDIRKVIFVCLALIVFCCGLNMIAVSWVGGLIALWLCVVQSILAIVCFLVIWVSQKFRPKQMAAMGTPYGPSEFIFLLVIGFMLDMLGFGFRSNVTATGLEIGFATGLVFFFALHEWLNKFGPFFSSQFLHLWTHLDAD